MVNVTESIVIAKPVAEMFAFAADQNNVPKWQKAVSSVEAPAGQVSKGARVINVRKFMGREMKTPFEVMDVKPNSMVMMKSTGGPVKIQVTVNFEPAGSGTKITTNLQAEVGGFFKVAEGMVAKQMKQQLATDFAVLKDLMEKQ